MGHIFNTRNSQIDHGVQIDSITLGVVFSTDDPHQMGRLKILCQAFGDDPNDETGENLPWATYVSPLAGMVNSRFKRGANEGSSVKGPIAYGLWGTPKRGSTVLVCCIDGDPYYRVWLGSIFDQGCVSTLPHGRYFYQKSNGTPDGPLDAYEDPIEPLYTNLGKAFTTREHNYEWRTRGADFSAAGNPSEYTDMSPSEHADEVEKTAFVSEDGKSFDIQNGYAENRLGEKGDDGDESSIYSWTSPGFHSISMDDRPENCRIRIRTTGGAQLLLDDTNERIYLSTAEGNNWVEMDQNGNIDVHGKNLSFHADNDINFTADNTFRVYAKKGIHMVSEAETHIETKDDFCLRVGANIRAHSQGKTNLQSGGTTNILAGKYIVEQAAKIFMNSIPAEPANEKPAKWTSRLPKHEPFPRTMTKDDFTHAPEVEYDDKKVGMIERGVEIVRGLFWRR